MRNQNLKWAVQWAFIFEKWLWLIELFLESSYSICLSTIFVLTSVLVLPVSELIQLLKVPFKWAIIHPKDHYHYYIYSHKMYLHIASVRDIIHPYENQWLATLWYCTLYLPLGWCLFDIYCTACYKNNLKKDNVSLMQIKWWIIICGEYLMNEVLYKWTRIAQILH